jgi:hypothetical protein
MRQRIITAVASVIGAAAVVAAPIALLAPSHAAPVAASSHEPSTWPHSSAANRPAYWVGFLEDRGYDDVVCVKDEIQGNESDDVWVVPQLDDEGRFYVLAVVKGGSKDSANQLYWRPVAGQELTHPTRGISHVILCTADKVTTSSPPPTTSTAPPTTSTAPPTKHTPTKTGPRVETDRPAEVGGPGAGLLAAGGALLALAGMGAVVLDGRRRGDHR